MSQNFETQVANDAESIKFNLFSQIREIVERGLEPHFIISSSCHYFNKTDRKLYLFYLTVSISKLDSIPENRRDLNAFEFDFGSVCDFLTL